MTEADWLLSDNPAMMIRYLTLEQVRSAGQFREWIDREQPLASKRKLRLWVEACRIQAGLQDRTWGDYNLDTKSGLTAALRRWGTWTPSVMPVNHLPFRATMLREIVGNPWRSVVLCDAIKPIVQLPADPKCPGCGPILRWNDGAIPKMAQAIYNGRSFEEMPIIADALEEAGCDSKDILRHCRGRERVPGMDYGKFTGIWVEVPLRGPHVRGCWVLDLLLGKE